jgi:hypothetical protein
MVILNLYIILSQSKILSGKYLMRIKFVFFIVLFFLSWKGLMSQNLSPAENEQLFSRYKRQLSHSVANGKNFLLVQLTRPLNAKELETLQPARSFSGYHLIVKESSVAGLGNLIKAQVEVSFLWKASDNLIKLIEHPVGQTLTIRLVYESHLIQLPALLKHLQGYKIDEQNALITAMVKDTAVLSILEQECVLFADLIPIAREEVAVNGADLSTNDIYAVHQFYPHLNGNGITVSVKEGLFDKDDIDLAGNVSSTSGSTASVTSHATTMSTLILGRGNTFMKGLGVAPVAKLTSSNFSNLLPDDLRQLSASNISVQNHSYGTDIDNIYGIDAVAYDKQLYESDTLVHVFSAGNKGISAPSSGTYQNMANTANLTGDFKQAKNVLVVGGINRENIVEALSSKGPAYDGRVKPELVAMGEDGTSGAAALTTGTVALLQQQYKIQTKKQPPSALIRSILVNSAEDIGIPGLDYTSGFGRLNALQAVQTMAEQRFVVKSVAEGLDYSFPLRIPSGQRDLKISLAWNDPPAMINSVQSIVNHLDLVLQTPTGETILPWVLNNYPNADSLALPAVRKRDELNNLQQITLSEIPPGTYLLKIHGRKVDRQEQTFAVSWQFKSAGTFNWTYPLNNDALFAGEDNYIRWTSTFGELTGKLSVSYNEGLSWNLIDNNIALKLGFYKWLVSNRFTRTSLKMEVNGNTYISPNFIISKAPALSVGYNCTTKIMLHWNPEPLATGYTVYNLKNHSMQPLSQTTDTLIEIPKTSITSSYFAVAANGKGFTGLRSYTIDYSAQGTLCYIRSFIGSTGPAAITLDLSLGSTYNLRKISWEKQTAAGQFTTLAQTDIMSGQLIYALEDNHPLTGIQFYRVTFLTTDGFKIQSDLLPVNFLKEAEFVFYPNPVLDYLSILSGDFLPYDLIIYNLIGQKVWADKGNEQNQFNLTSLTAGFYFGIIYRDGKALQKIKIIKK